MQIVKNNRSLSGSGVFHILFFSLSIFLFSACGGSEVLSEKNMILVEENRSSERVPQSHTLLDPLYEKQWYLHQKPGINVTSIWQMYQGEGISTGVVDTGIEAAHPDLIENIDLLRSFRYEDKSSDPTPTERELHDPFVDAPHGTAVAGIIAASQNEIGISGVAPKATLVGLNVFSRPDDSAFEDAMQYSGIDISSNSWGADLSFGLDNDRVILDAIVSKMQTDPIIYTFAAGNEVSNSAFSAILNSRYTLVIGATDHQSKVTLYSNYGSNILCVAPGGDAEQKDAQIVTTDLSGALYGYDVTGDHFDILSNSTYAYTDMFYGTSAAVPMVSGVIALMLEANKNLDYRDIKYVLAHTVQRIDSNHTSWVQNGVGLWTSRYYGFGLVDAQKAVEMAEKFSSLPAEMVIEKSLNDLHLSIQDNSVEGVALSFEVAEEIVLEYVTLEINSDHDYSGDLMIKLTSPYQTEVVLADGNTITEDPYSPWEFGAIGYMDESSQGRWKLSVSDIVKNDIGKLNSATLRLYGHQK